MPAPRTKSPHKQVEKRSKAGAASASAGSTIDRFLFAHGGQIALLLCIYAGLRVLIFAAAFPIFNNVDEQFHLDAIRMYARGQWPGKDLPHVDADSAKLIALYGTLEYVLDERTMEKFHLQTPPYRLPPEQASQASAQVYSHWKNSTNIEAQSTPLYYLLSAVWYRIGQVLGLPEWESPYWIRLLNPAAFVLLVWASYKFVRCVYPEGVFLWLGVPALLAVFPQDVYFGMNRDVLSAPMTAVVLLLMVKAVEKERGSWLLIASSFMVGLAFLVNVSNCVLFGALAITLWYWARRSTATSLTKTWNVSAALAASAALPILWMLRNHAVIGDLTGSRAKIESLGWTMKPLRSILDHPIFSFDGLAYFLSHLGRTFWRGEYVWHLQPMRWEVADWFYLISSGVLIIVSAVHFFRKPDANSSTGRWAECQALLLVLASSLFMAAISLPFDFHNCFYPSQQRPFFVSGRIISGALLPFVLIYVSGIELLLAPIRKWVHPVVILACLMLFITITEFQIRRAVFSSPSNFFALRAWPAAR